MDEKINKSILNPHTGKITLKEKKRNHCEDFTRDSWQKKGTKIIGAGAILALIGATGVGGVKYFNSQLKNKNVELKTEQIKAENLEGKLVKAEKDKTKIETKYVTRIKEISKDVRGSYQSTIDYNIATFNDGNMVFCEVFNKPTKETMNAKQNKENYDKQIITLSKIISVFPEIKKYEKDILEGKLKFLLKKNKGAKQYIVDVLETGEYGSSVKRYNIDDKKIKELKQHIR